MLHTTFSIAARAVDAAGEVAFGVAVSTARPAVGAFVPWASPHGAVVTQARTCVAHGERGVHLIDAGVPVAVALEGLLAADDGREERQLHGVDGAGGYAFTGAACVPWAGHRIGDGFTVAGNMLAGPDVVEAMAAASEEGPGEELAARLVRALEAGQAAGGDKRGKISAALLVVSRGEPRPYHNQRVDEHAEPVAELRRLFDAVRSDHRAILKRQPDHRIERVKW